MRNLRYLVFWSAWCLFFPESLIADDATMVTAMTLKLRHTRNCSPGTTTLSILRTLGGDIGMPAGQGFSWRLIQPREGADHQDTRSVDKAGIQFAEGFIFALKHSLNNKGQNITLLGKDAKKDGDIPGFKAMFGGDEGASSGEGLWWYETTGKDMHGVACNMTPAMMASIPKGAILGLKHSTHQPRKTFTWGDKVFDPANPAISPPDGFIRVFGGDLGCPKLKGYFWYEKMTGPEDDQAGSDPVADPPQTPADVGVH